MYVTKTYPHKVKNGGVTMEPLFYIKNNGAIIIPLLVILLHVDKFGQVLVTEVKKIYDRWNTS